MCLEYLLDSAVSFIEWLSNYVRPASVAVEQRERKEELGYSRMRPVEASTYKCELFIASRLCTSATNEHAHL